MSLLAPATRRARAASLLLLLSQIAACASAAPAAEEAAHGATHAAHSSAAPLPPESVHSAHGPAAPTTHPEPRAGATAERVADPARVVNAGYPDEARMYVMAKEIPQVLDGLYCHCDCSKHKGHYSLLSCFESGHAIQCGVCLREAELAHKLTKDGKTLQEIRTAIDVAFAI